MSFRFVFPALAASIISIAAALPTTAQAADGEAVFRKCKACHTLEAGKHRVGPSLAGVVGRQAGTAEGFTRYKGLEGADWTWTEEEIAKYLKDPSAYTKEKTGQRSAMTFKLTKDDEIAAVIEYLKAH